jgi:predicted nucleic acid-binding protein
MIVVADATPLHYLLLIGEADVLPVLYGPVFIPPAVLHELTQKKTPEAVRRWIIAPLDWIQVRAPLAPPSPLPLILGAGEREAIALAEELKSDVLLVDDWAARREAERRNLAIQGTLGLLGLASERGLTDLPRAIARLRTTNFRASEELIQRMMERDADIKKGSGG